jgi:hypothetical protein
MPTPQEEYEDYIRRLIASEEETRVDPPVSPYQGNTYPPTQPPPAGQANPVYDSLPRRVDEVDMDATRVTPAAYQPTFTAAPVHAAAPCLAQE